MTFDELLFDLAEKLDIRKCPPDAAGRRGGIGGVYHSGDMADFLGMSRRQLDHLRATNNPSQSLFYNVQALIAHPKNKLRVMKEDRI